VKTRRKIIHILVTLSFLLTLLVPMVGPASAKSLNSVDKVLTVADDATISASSAPVLTIKEDEDFTNHFKVNDTFRLVLPNSNVDWHEYDVKINGQSVKCTVYAVKRTDQVLEITFPDAATLGTNALGDGKVDKVDVTLSVKLDNVDGNIDVKVEPLDSAITGGSYTFLVAGEGDTTAVAESVETIGKTGTGGTIRIEETFVGSVGNEKQSFRLKLPSNFEWNNMTTTEISFAGGFAGSTEVSVTGSGTSELTVTFNPPDDRSQRGTVYVTPKIKADSDASYGDIEVSISGDEFSDDDVIVAKYADWGVSVKVKEVKELIAGKFDDQKTEKITIEENVPGTFLNGRDLNIAFPDWVKVTRIYDKSADITVDWPNLDGKDSDFDINIKGTSSGDTAKIEFKLELSVEANKSGDIEAVISGAGVDETTLLVAKAVAPVSAKAETVKDVKIGVQGQEVPDIIITENIKEAVEQKAEKKPGGVTGEIVLELPTGVKFAATPKVEVTEGNLELKDDQARLTDNDTIFRVPVDSESTKPSTIKISGIKLTLDRTVPEGDLLVKVKGSALVENYRDAEGWLNGSNASGNSNDIDAGEFDTATVVKVKVANCVTPAPKDLTATTVFKIGDTKYTVNGVEMTMDVAPYIKDDRTYLPVRYAAQAAGVADNNIIWNGAEQSVVLIKGDRVVKLTIGNNVMMINGIAMPMDVAPEIVDPGRTMLPVRWVAQALGCEVLWDAATQSVTIQ